MKQKGILLGMLLLSSVTLCGCSGKLMDVLEAEIDANSYSPEEIPQSEEGGTETVAVMEQETETETETETEAGPLVQTVTISAVGDCALGPVQTHGYAGSLYEYYDNYGEEYFFSGVRDVFEQDDFTLINLECVLTNESNRVDKTWNIKGYPEYTGILTSSFVEGCSLGNNHTFDYGQKSHTDTEEALAAAGVTYAMNDQYGIYTTSEGLTIGVISVDLLNGSSYEKYFEEGIAVLQEQNCNLIVCCCHWGKEYEYYPNEYQQSLAHKLIDLGADLVVGNHPHVLEGIEVYNGKVICYSLGNFCFGANSNPKDKNTIIFQQTFTFVDGVLQEQIDARMIPCRLSSATGYNDYQPTILTGDDASTLIDKMNEYSKPYSEVYFDSEGVLR